MAQGRCWSSIMPSRGDRAALRVDPHSTWPITCALIDGHAGPHSGDGDRRFGRRAWLVWGDFALEPFACRDQDPCPAGAAERTPCQLFAGHEGPHLFPAPPVVSTPVPAPSAAATPAPTALPVTPTPVRASSRVAQSVADPVDGSGHRADDWRKSESDGRDEDWRSEGLTVGKRSKKKHRRDDDVVLSAEANEQATTESRTAARPMIEVKSYADLSRSSLVEVVQPDGEKRIVVMPVYGDSQPTSRTVTSTRASLSELEAASVSASQAVVTEVVGEAARVLSTQDVGPMLADDGREQVREQVGAALREVSQALAKLADSLDPR